MLTASKLKLLRELITGASKEELAWISGYVAALVGEEISPTTIARPGVNKITIAYGSETGNAKRVATGFAAKAKKNGINAKLVSLEQYKVNDLTKEDYFFTVISTQGDGEPPAGSKKFYDHIHNNGFKVNGLKYGVLALGDTSYPLFCKAGEDVDEQLKKLGGQRIVQLQKCDTDYEPDAEKWFSQVLENLSLNNNSVKESSQETTSGTIKKNSGRHNYSGTIITNVNLNDTGSDKETHHIEIAVDSVDYLPGDSLGLIPENPDHIISDIINLLGVKEDAIVVYKNEEHSLSNLLKKKVNVIFLAERVVHKYGTLAGQEIPATKIGLLDLLRIYPLGPQVPLNSLVEILDPITPRLYSIASSPEGHSGEIHLTIARDKFFVNGECRYGHCSDFFSQVETETNLNFYIHKNSQFRLPENNKDIIMVGPGTGVAPFRSFIAHRDAIGAEGKNWLFFGDRNFISDFLYQTEWQNWLQTGTLTRMDVAFSRDQDEKVYVQHKMLKHGKEIFDWLQNGAYFYICGAREPMSIDVENALLSIVEQYGTMTVEEALDYLENLKEEGRLLKDVY